MQLAPASDHAIWIPATGQEPICIALIRAVRGGALQARGMPEHQGPIRSKPADCEISGPRSFAVPQARTGLADLPSTPTSGLQIPCGPGIYLAPGRPADAVRFSAGKNPPETTLGASTCQGPKAAAEGTNDHCPSVGVPRFQPLSPI